MRIVLDTNCLLPAVFPRSMYHWVWKIVTNDKHFNVLKEIDFPPVKVVDIVEFREMLGVGN